MLASSVMANSSACAEVYGSAAPTCAGYLSRACVFLIPAYSPVGPVLECGQLAVAEESGRRPGLLLDTQTFAPEHACRCLPGYEKESTATGNACAPCAADHFRSAELSACASCPVGSTREAELGRSIWDCTCAAGRFMSADICELCPADTYSGVVGSTSISSCVQCPPGTVSPKGTGNIGACVCPPGSTVVSVGSDVCQPCSVGTCFWEGGVHSLSYDSRGRSADDPDAWHRQPG